MEKLIAMQENLGLGHKGTVIITTQKRVDGNIPCIATVNEPEQALSLVDRWNAHDTLKAKADMLDEMCNWNRVLANHLGHYVRMFAEQFPDAVSVKLMTTAGEKLEEIISKAEALK